MLKMKKCCSVPFPEKLSEQYEVLKNKIVANVGTDKIMDILLDFIDMHNEWLFFILEIPTNMDDEPTDEEGNIIGKHKDVYYIDGCRQENIKAILADIGELLIDDGMSSFGIGGHESKEEILFERYNVTTIFSKNPNKYENFFETYGIIKTENLITAWQTFSKEHYGKCSLYTVGGRDIYSIPEDYKKYGMYFSERRED